MSVDENQVVTLGSPKANQGDERLEAAVPSSRGLLEAIESFVEITHIIRMHMVVVGNK